MSAFALARNISPNHQGCQVISCASRSVSTFFRYLFPSPNLVPSGGDGFPDLLASFPLSNPANRPGCDTMPECRFNKSTVPGINVSFPPIARVALSSRSSPSLLVVCLLYSRSFSAFAHLSNERHFLSRIASLSHRRRLSLSLIAVWTPLLVGRRAPLPDLLASFPRSTRVRNYA